MIVSNNETPRQIPKAVLDCMASFKFDSFNTEKKTWKFYFQRFELELSLLQINISEYYSHRRDLLLCAIGGELYRIAAEHFEPKQLREVTHAELTSCGIWAMYS